MANTLLIGGGGFIGLHLSEALVKTGRDIAILGRGKSLELNLGNNFSYYARTDISKAKYRELLFGADEIIYLAYSSVPQTSFLDPIRDINENLSYAVEVFDELKKSNVQKLIYVSSGGTVYGQTQKDVIDETHPTNPISPYGITKLATEKYGLMYLASNNLPFVIVRPSNPYGERQMPFKGQGFIATAIAAGLRNEKVKVFGEFGTIRDYIYIHDLIDGLIAAIDFGEVGEVYNIGTGRGSSNLEILNLINGMANETGLIVNYEIFNERPFDVKRNVLDSNRLKLISGWDIKVNLNEGLKTTIDWFKSSSNVMSHA